jgi:hypothetical protein
MATWSKAARSNGVHVPVDSGAARPPRAGRWLRHSPLSKRPKGAEQTRRVYRLYQSGILAVRGSRGRRIVGARRDLLRIFLHEEHSRHGLRQPLEAPSHSLSPQIPTWTSEPTPRWGGSCAGGPECHQHWSAPWHHDGGLPHHVPEGGSLAGNVSTGPVEDPHGFLDRG